MLWDYSKTKCQKKWKSSEAFSKKKMNIGTDFLEHASNVHSIQVYIMAYMVFFGPMRKQKAEKRPCFHNVGSYATAFLYFIETDTTIGTPQKA